VRIWAALLYLLVVLEARSRCWFRPMPIS